MLFKSEVDFADLIRISSGGLSILSYPQIVDMLKTRYKEVYGSDINLAPETADGVWIHDIALLINNILQANQMLYRNLDVDSASGVYLENLCKLSNVYRKQATSSQARVQIINNGNTPITMNGVSCLDVNGLIWDSLQSFTLQPYGTTSGSEPNVVQEDRIEVVVVCRQSGSIKAPIGTIKQVVNIDADYLLSVVQLENADVGSDVETDAELKARRNDSSSPIGMTTIDSLVGAILNIAGIRDCIIVNNYTNSTLGDGTGGTIEYKGFDGTQILPHSIYVVVRCNGVVDNQVIGDTIYQKLTAGVRTIQADAHVEQGEGKSIVHYPQYYGQSDSQFNTTIYWKQASAIAPQIELTISEYAGFNKANIETYGQDVISYLNGLELNSDLDADEIKMQLLGADTGYKGRPTFAITNVNIASYTNKLSYYNYTSASFNPTNHKLTIA